MPAVQRPAVPGAAAARPVPGIAPVVPPQIPAASRPPQVAPAVPPQAPAAARPPAPGAVPPRVPSGQVPGIAPIVPPVAPAGARPAAPNGVPPRAPAGQPPAISPVVPPVAPAGARPPAPGARPVPQMAPVVPLGARSVGPAAAVAPVTPPRAAAVGAVRPPAIPAPAAAQPAAPPPPPSDDGSRLTPEQLRDLEQRLRMLDQLDYFEVLKLEKTAVPAEIKKAFYRESRTYHPDRFFHIPDPELKERVKDLYKRVTEAYYMLRDDAKRKKYLADVTGPDRAQKLRFTESSEAETKQAAKKEQEEQIGLHPKGRQFYQTAMNDMAGERWSAAERNLKMALTFEPQNARYKEKLAEVVAKINEAGKQGNNFMIK